MLNPTLHHTTLSQEGIHPTQWLLFLHGILGAGVNLRSLASRFVQEQPQWGAVLVDLREHGKSKGFAPLHTLANAASDVVKLIETLNLPAAGILGHSFGGKVALLASTKTATPLEHVWVIDSFPGSRPQTRGKDEVFDILRALQSLPKDFPTRDAFRTALQQKNVEPSIAQWLSMNLERHKKSQEQATESYRWGINLNAIEALLTDYFAQDLWSLLENPRQGSTYHLVLGGRSSAFRAEDRERARALSQAHPSQVFLHVIEHAGHWVHVDAPNELFQLMTD